MSVPKYTSPYDLDGRIPLRQAIPLGLGYGIGSTAAVQNFMPQWLKYIFGGSGIVPAADHYPACRGRYNPAAYAGQDCGPLPGRF